MDIKILTAADAESYRACRLEALQAHPEYFAASFEAEESRPASFYAERLSGTAFTFGVFKDGALSGIAVLAPETGQKTRHKAWIYSVYIKPVLRRSGAGKMLIQSIIAKSKDLGMIEQLQLSVSVRNKPAKKLYQSLGFEVYGREKRALKVNGSYVDEEHMILFL